MRNPHNTGRLTTTYSRSKQRSPPWNAATASYSGNCPFPVKLRDVADLILLAALWGASFLFMRIATPEFGTFALIELRVAIAALFLTPLLLTHGAMAELRSNWRPICAVGVLNSAIPFCLLAYSTLYLSAGFAAIVNASSPLFGGLIAWLWLRERLNHSRTAGLLIGFAGVVVLVWDKVSLQFDHAGAAIGAAILGSAFYGLAANYARKYVPRTSPRVVAAGSQIGAALLLLPPALWLWPDNPISMRAWVSVILMGTLSTGIAYILYFRLIASVGPVRAITVTFLVPVFAVIWGVLLIDESLTRDMLIGSAVILTGTALATGLIGDGGRTQKQNGAP